MADDAAAEEKAPMEFTDDEKKEFRKVLRCPVHACVTSPAQRHAWVRRR